MTLNNSINQLLSLNDKEYAYWKMKMKIFIKGMDCDIWDDFKNDHSILTCQVNNVVGKKHINL